MELHCFCIVLQSVRVGAQALEIMSCLLLVSEGSGVAFLVTAPHMLSPCPL